MRNSAYNLVKPLSSSWSDAEFTELRIKIENHLADLALYITVQDDNPFRSRAYKKVKANLYRFERVLPDYILTNKLHLIPGVGKTIANEIAEFAKHGESKRLETLKTGLPLYLEKLKDSLNHADWLAHLFRKQSIDHPLFLFVTMESCWLHHQQLLTIEQTSKLRNVLLNLLFDYQSELVISDTAVNWRNLLLLQFTNYERLIDSEKETLSTFENLATPMLIEPIRLAQRSFQLNCLNITKLPQTVIEFEDLCSKQFYGIFCSWLHPKFFQEDYVWSLSSKTKCVAILLHPLLEKFNRNLLHAIDSDIPIWFAGLAPGIDLYFLKYAKAFLDEFVDENVKILNKLPNTRFERFLESLADPD